MIFELAFGKSFETTFSYDRGIVSVKITTLFYRRFRYLIKKEGDEVMSVQRHFDTG